MSTESSPLNITVASLLHSSVSKKVLPEQTRSSEFKIKTCSCGSIPTTSLHVNSTTTLNNLHVPTVISTTQSETLLNLNNKKTGVRIHNSDKSVFINVTSASTTNLSPKQPPDKAEVEKEQNENLFDATVPVVSKMSMAVELGTEKLLSKTYIKRKAPIVQKNGLLITNSSYEHDDVKKHKFLNGPINSKAIFVPRGWNRILDKGLISYSSPNRSRIGSMADLLTYLKSDDTCKCGLQCPFRIEELFSFDPTIPSKFDTTEETLHQANCLIKKKFEELFPNSSKVRYDSRGRKLGGKHKRCVSADEPLPPNPTNPDRKKILLTGASPLEMFQSGMSAINSLSTIQFKTVPKVDNNKSIIANLVTHTPTVTTQSVEKPAQKVFRSQSYPGIHQDNFENKIPSAITTDIAGTSDSNTSDSQSQPVNMPFPKSLMGEKRKRMKSSRGKAHVTKSGDELTLPKRTKKSMTSALKKASDAQLIEYLQQHQALIAREQLLTHGNNDIKSLNNLGSNSSSQILTNPTLSTNTDSKTSDIYRHLHTAVLNQQIQNAAATAAYGNTKYLVSSKNQPTISISDGKDMSNLEPTSSTKAPPNRTVSSNDLSEALHRNLNTSLSSNVVSNASSTALTIAPGHEYEPLSKPISSSSTSGRIATVSKPTATSLSTFVSLNQPVNKPLVSSTTSSTNVTHVKTSVPSQQMVLVQLVSQNNTTDKSTTVKVNTPIVRAFPMAQQAYVHTQGQNKYLVMGKNNATPSALHTLAIQTAPPNGHVITTANTGDNSKRTLQIIPSQISPQASPAGVPLQYVTAVSRPGVPVQYLPTLKTSYIYSNTVQQQSSTTPTLSAISSNGNFVRIAPAVQPTVISINAYEQEKKLKQTFSHRLPVVPADVVSKASSFLNNVALSNSKLQSATTMSPESVNNAPGMTIADYMKAVGLPSFPLSLSSTTSSMKPSSVAVHSSIADTNSLKNLMVSEHSPQTSSDVRSDVDVEDCNLDISKRSESVLQTEKSIDSDTAEWQKSDSNSVELNLHCDEGTSDLLTSGESQSPKDTGHNISKTMTFQHDDLVWATITGYPAWPGKVLKSEDSEKPLDVDELSVTWFGSNQVHTVKVSQCRRFNGMGKNMTSKKYCESKEVLSDFDKAIIIALQEMEQRKVTSVITNDCVISATLVAEIKESMAVSLSEKVN